MENVIPNSGLPHTEVDHFQRETHRGMKANSSFFHMIARKKKTPSSMWRCWTAGNSSSSTFNWTSSVIHLLDFLFSILYWFRWKYFEHIVESVASFTDQCDVCVSHVMLMLMLMLYLIGSTMVFTATVLYLVVVFFYFKCLTFLPIFCFLML